jgi:hypothetical protein
LGRIGRAILDPEQWRSALVHNFALKLISLAFAFGLWAFVNFGERDTEEALKVPLELRNIPAAVVITSPRVDFIDLRVMGPRTLLGRIDRSRLSIALDLSGVRPGPAVFRVSGESVNLPRGVRVVRINPAAVTLDLERVGKKTVPVQLRIDGEPPAGFKVVSVRVVPESVEITGPADDVKAVESVETQALKLDVAEVGVIQRDVSLESAGDFVSFSTPRVTAEVGVEEVVVRQEVADVPIELRNSANTAEVAPLVATVTLRGPKRTVAALESGDVRLFVDASEGGGVVKVTAELPDTVELISIHPKTVKLTVVSSTPTPDSATPTVGAGGNAKKPRAKPKTAEGKR